MEEDGIAKFIFLGNIHAREEQRRAVNMLPHFYKNRMSALYISQHIFVLHKVELYLWFILHTLIPLFLQILFKRRRSKEKSC